jgi:hypothetical protein
MTLQKTSPQKQANWWQVALAWPLGCLLMVGAISLAITGCHSYASHKARMSVVPVGLEVEGIIYRSEKSWGLPFLALPGDNETGVIVYELSDTTSERILNSGYQLVQRFGKQGDDAWTLDDPRRRGLYSTWNETPTTHNARGRNLITEAALIDEDDKAPMRIGSFLSRYGFEIPVRTDIIQKADDGLSKPNSYYSYGRSGMFRIIPRHQMAVYAYAG